MTKYSNSSDTQQQHENIKTSLYRLMPFSFEIPFSEVNSYAISTASASINVLLIY